MILRVCCLSRKMMMLDCVTRVRGVAQDVLVRRGMTRRVCGNGKARARNPARRQRQRHEDSERSSQLPVHGPTIAERQRNECGRESTGQGKRRIEGCTRRA